MMFCLLGSGPKTGLKEFTAVMKGAVMLQRLSRVPGLPSPCHLYQHLQKKWPDKVLYVCSCLSCMVISHIPQLSCEEARTSPSDSEELPFQVCAQDICQRNMLGLLEVILRSIVSVLEQLKYSPLLTGAQTVLSSLSLLVIWWLYSCDYQHSFNRPWIST